MYLYGRTFFWNFGQPEIFGNYWAPPSFFLATFLPCHHGVGLSSGLHVGPPIVRRIVIHGLLCGAWSQRTPQRKPGLKNRPKNRGRKKRGRKIGKKKSAQKIGKKIGQKKSGKKKIGAEEKHQPSSHPISTQIAVHQHDAPPLAPPLVHHLAPPMAPPMAMGISGSKIGGRQREANQPSPRFFPPDFETSPLPPMTWIPP